MKVLSINLGSRTEVKTGNKIVSTGIFKHPVNEAVYLSFNGVQNDHVDDKKHHGGFDKACYLFPSIHYPQWEQLFPELEWNFGMFGENLTIEGMDEDQIYIGDIFRIGNAIIQISEPRQPCFKLNIRLNNSKAIREMIDSANCGSYARVLKEGYVSQKDELHLIEHHDQLISVKDVFKLIYNPDYNKTLFNIAIIHPLLSNSLKEELLRKTNN